jgi:hypothetical protein
MILKVQLTEGLFSVEGGIPFRQEYKHARRSRCRKNAVERTLVPRVTHAKVSLPSAT